MKIKLEGYTIEEATCGPYDEEIAIKLQNNFWPDNIVIPLSNIKEVINALITITMIIENRN